MNTLVNNMKQFILLSVVESRDDAGVVISELSFKCSDGADLRLAFPYSPMYKTLSPGQLILGQQIAHNKYHFNFEFLVDTNPYIGQLISCPFCGNILINLHAGETTQLYCFNPACETDSARQYHMTISLLECYMNAADIEFLYLYMIENGLTNCHFYAILAALEMFYSNSKNTPIDLWPIYEACKTFVLKCKPSQFLKLLKIPGIYYEQIELLDTAFDSIEEFYNAMHNYRSMKDILFGYNDDLMSLIYVILQLNKIYIDKFFEKRNWFLKTLL